MYFQFAMPLFLQLFNIYLNLNIFFYKPIKRGIKLWIRSSAKNGYCHEFRVYLGKQGEEPKKKLGSYFYVVDDLANAIKGKWFELFYDNLFSSVALAKHLYDCQIRTCATFRKNRRGIIPEWKTLKDKELDRGTIIQYQDRSSPYLTITLWRDTKNVVFLSSTNECGKTTQCSRRINGRPTAVSQPSCAASYCANYAGIDRFDSIRQAYTVGHASKKSWRYLFNYFLSAAISNAWIIYKEASTKVRTKKWSQLDFRLELAHQLIGGYQSSLVCNKRFTLHNMRHNVINHDNVPNHKLCRLCYAHKHFWGYKKRTKFQCRACNIFLCKKCHFKFHDEGM